LQGNFGLLNIHAALAWLKSFNHEIFNYAKRLVVFPRQRGCIYFKIPNKMFISILKMNLVARAYSVGLAWKPFKCFSFATFPTFVY